MIVRVKSEEEIINLLLKDDENFPKHSGWDKFKNTQKPFCNTNIEVSAHQGGPHKSRQWYVHQNKEGEYIYFREDFLNFPEKPRTKLPDLKWKSIYTPDKHGLVELRGKMYCADKANCDCKFPDVSDNYQDHLGDLLIKLDMLENALTENKNYPGLPEARFHPMILNLAGEKVSVFFDNLRNIIDGLRE